MSVRNIRIPSTGLPGTTPCPVQARAHRSYTGCFQLDILQVTAEFGAARGDDPSRTRRTDAGQGHPKAMAWPVSGRYTDMLGHDCVCEDHIHSAVPCTDATELRPEIRPNETTSRKSSRHAELFFLLQTMDLQKETAIIKLIVTHEAVLSSYRLV